MAKQQFTERGLIALKPKEKPYKVTDASRRGEGTLLVKVMPNGDRVFYFRYRHDRTDRMLKIGRHKTHDADPKGVTLKQAREKASEHTRLLAEVGDLKAHMEAEERRKEEARRQAERAARTGTLAHLCAAYADSLDAAGKASARGVRNALKRHVVDAWPGLAATNAKEIAAPDVQAILAKMVKDGLTREINKVRSYLHAAFTYAAKSDNDPRRMADDGVVFGIHTNPAAMVPRIVEYDRAGNRNLTAEELRLYWEALEGLQPVSKAALRLALVLGGQRLTQLTRAPWSDYDLEAGVVILRDAKGRGGIRDHLLPLSDWARELLDPMRDLNAAHRWPFTNSGRAPVRVDTLSRAVTDISAALTREHEIEPFTARDLRRTAETMLASLGVDRETRAQLLSHGRASGVQAQHYDRYHYLAEKRRALEIWETHLRETFGGGKGGSAVMLSGGER